MNTASIVTGASGTGLAGLLPKAESPVTADAVLTLEIAAFSAGLFVKRLRRHR